jgi:hypothetical protein
MKAFLIKYWRIVVVAAISNAIMVTALAMVDHLVFSQGPDYGTVFIAAMCGFYYGWGCK